MSNNVFVKSYRRLITEPATDKEAYGYWLFVIGTLFGIIGLLTFIWSTTLERGTPTFWNARQWAVVLSSIGLPLMMLGVVFRLPVRRSVDRFGALGVLICIIAAAGFVIAYPGNWNVAVNDYSPEIIVAYAVGMGIVAISALILPAATQSIEIPPVTESSSTSPATEEEVLDVSQATIDVYPDRSGKYRWRLIHRNGNIIADSGESYRTLDGAQQAVSRVKRYAEDADTLELETGAFQVYEDLAGEYRWRLFASNGRIIADSGEGYSSKSGANDAVDRVRSESNHEFDVYKDNAGDYRWRLLSPNGRVIADSGQGYSSQDGAQSAVARVTEYFESADTLELDTGAFELYEDRGGEYRWRLLASNGEIIADSGEGYSSASNARRGIESVRSNAPDAVERISE